MPLVIATLYGSVVPPNQTSADGLPASSSTLDSTSPVERR
ncbi:Uncharacterised protein [Chlamydia trachomatis]|nr:Uncharacterised protein [Chlamydia trachomatis]